MGAAIVDKNSGVLSEITHIPYEMELPLLCIECRYTLARIHDGN